MSFTVFAMVLCAALLHAIWNILLKVQGDRLTIMALISAVSGIFSLFILPFVDFPAPAAWPYIWVSLVVHNAYYIFLVLAYKYGDLSHVYPLSRGSAPLIVTGISVIFVGEFLTRQGYLAVAIISLGIISLTLTRGSDGMKNLRAVFFALGTGCLIAVYTVLDGLGARLSGSPHGYIFWYLALDTVPLAAFVLWWRGGSALKEVRRSWRVGVIASSMVVVSIWIITWALTLAPLALVSALRESSIVFAVLFGVVFLKEKLDLNRLAAITMTLAGTILLKTSK